MKRFIEETGLPFHILVDERRDVVKRYGVWHRFGIDAWNLSRPAVFLVDRSGIIRYIFVASRQSEYPSQEELGRAIASLA